MRCMIIDDEPYARKLLSDFIAKVPNLVLEGAFPSALQAMPLLANKTIDVIFLDIKMPGISGIDFLKSLEKKPNIIFTTAFAEYALEGFELNVIDYLPKPFDFNRFLKAVNKLPFKVEKPITFANHDKPAFIFVKDGFKLIKLYYRDVLYIQGAREYVTIYLKNRQIMSLQSLRSLELELPSDFIRVHNSFIINLPAVESIAKNELEIAGKIIPIGITYRNQFMEHIKRYESGKTNAK